MHIGNVYAMLAAWLSARACPDGRIALRIEDIDVPRVVPDADRWIMDDLAWLGLDWDGEPVYQSQRGEIYESALRALESRAMPGAREVGTGAGLELAACARDNGGGPVREADGDPEPGARGAFPSLIYPCFCSRAEIRAASAPQEGDGFTVYPGKCRRLLLEHPDMVSGRLAAGDRHSLRVAVPEAGSSAASRRSA
jgi:glutamyl-tRNA synthetase